jgi:predicted methyltransferase
MRRQFPLFQSHLDLAHYYWQQLVRSGDTVIDATCGNGHDTLILSKQALSPGAGKVHAYDIQPEAIETTRMRLAEQLDPELRARVALHCSSHVSFSSDIPPQSVQLIVYNLGYLPGGDKRITTTTECTLKSLDHAMKLLRPGGLISVTLYPGHAEGAIEAQAIVNYCQGLEATHWSVCLHQWANRRTAPQLLLLQRALEASTH